MSGDHIVPLSHGGENVASKIRVVCVWCNSRRGNLSLSAGILSSFAQAAQEATDDGPLGA
jgi:5-methylcytosine-specific restriction endonuclease McrA